MEAKYLKCVFTREELETIRSKARYWYEVAGREHGAGEILQREMAELYQIHGLSLLWAVAEYAEYHSPSGTLEKLCQASASAALSKAGVV